jgi:hypothetical protein
MHIRAVQHCLGAPSLPQVGVGTYCSRAASSLAIANDIRVIASPEKRDTMTLVTGGAPLAFAEGNDGMTLVKNGCITTWATQSKCDPEECQGSQDMQAPCLQWRVVRRCVVSGLGVASSALLSRARATSETLGRGKTCSCWLI